MVDFDWDAPAQLWQLDGPPAPDSPRIKLADDTLRACVAAVLGRQPAERMDLAISVTGHPLLRKVDIELLGRRADYAPPG